MPFSKYLRQQQQQQQQDQDGFINRQPTSSNNLIHFQIPPFVYDDTPTLAPGGGAEVLPLCHNQSRWFTDNGFTNSYVNPSTAAAIPLFHRSVYSSSGFDVLDILARIPTRPNQSIVLGSVDMACPFVVADTRRYDHPIVYCSPAFCVLTGYSEHEVLGRNCRFLQAPPSAGAVRGAPRLYTSETAVMAMRKALAADKEVQVPIVNYRKDGGRFVNLVSVVPVKGEGDVVWHVGFQVDLTESVGAWGSGMGSGMVGMVGLGQGLAQGQGQGRGQKDRSSMSTSTSTSTLQVVGNDKKKTSSVIPPLCMSDTLAALLKNPNFIQSTSLGGYTGGDNVSVNPTIQESMSSSSQTTTTTTTTSTTTSTSSHPLSHLLLSHTPDFIHVVSLKGAFLYVAPGVRRVLGYAPEELVGRSMADLAHPEDVVPLERQLKESSGGGGGNGAAAAAAAAGGTGEEGDGDGQYVHHQQHQDQHQHQQKVQQQQQQQHHQQPQQQQQHQRKAVAIVFRARTKSGRYVWVECRGRLHVEPGKGRKAIVLSARAREMEDVEWGRVWGCLGGVSGSGGGLLLLEEDGKGKGREVVPAVVKEFWAMLGGVGCARGAVLAVGRGVGEVLGWEKGRLIGRRVVELVVGREAREEVWRVLGGGGTGVVRCAMRTERGGVVNVILGFYKSIEGENGEGEDVMPAHVLLQVRLDEGGEEEEYPRRQQQYRHFGGFEGSSGVGSSSGSGSGSMSTLVKDLGSTVYPPGANIFEELETGRGSSWQYELQQLRFMNARLGEEVRALEGELCGGGGNSNGESAVAVAIEGDSQMVGLGYDLGVGLGHSEHPGLSVLTSSSSSVVPGYEVGNVNMYPSVVPVSSSSSTSSSSSSSSAAATYRDVGGGGFEEQGAAGYFHPGLGQGQLLSHSQTQAQTRIQSHSPELGNSFDEQGIVAYLQPGLGQLQSQQSRLSPVGSANPMEMGMGYSQHHPHHHHHHLDVQGGRMEQQQQSQIQQQQQKEHHHQQQYEQQVQMSIQIPDQQQQQQQQQQQLCHVPQQQSQVQLHPQFAMQSRGVEWEKREREREVPLYVNVPMSTVSLMEVHRHQQQHQGGGLEGEGQGEGRQWRVLPRGVKRRLGR